jgi:hypothetical protein
MIDQRTVDEKVFRKGLSGAYLLEKRRVKGLHKRFLLDVVIGKMAKDAGLHIATGIDMEVFSPSGNASFGEAPVIPEVHHEERLRRPEIGKPFPYPGPLFRGGHQAEVCIATNGDIMEVPEENASLLHKKIDKGITSNGL